jgi:hypothetical protein
MICDSGIQIENKKAAGCIQRSRRTYVYGFLVRFISPIAGSPALNVTV